MGKIIGHYKTVGLLLLFLALHLSADSGLAAYREDILFEQAYESYLSYRPEKALEYFALFLKQFPGSSAKDAALFWNAKSLMQLKRTDDAIKSFALLRELFPESPFIPFVEKELALCYQETYAPSKNDASDKGKRTGEIITSDAKKGLNCESRLSELEGERKASEILLKNLGREKEEIAEKLRESNARLTTLQMDMDGMRDREGERAKDGEATEILINKLRDSEMARKDLQKNLSKTKQDLTELQDEMKRKQARRDRAVSAAKKKKSNKSRAKAPRG